MYFSLGFPFSTPHIPTEHLLKGKPTSMRIDNYTPPWGRRQFSHEGSFAVSGSSRGKPWTALVFMASQTPGLQQGLSLGLSP